MLPDRVLQGAAGELAEGRSPALPAIGQDDDPVVPGRGARDLLQRAEEPVDACNDIVERVGISKLTVIGWKRRYAAEGIGGLEDRPKPGRRRVIDDIEVVSATLERCPSGSG